MSPPYSVRPARTAAWGGSGVVWLSCGVLATSYDTLNQDMNVQNALYDVASNIYQAERQDMIGISTWDILSLCYQAPPPGVPVRGAQRHHAVAVQVEIQTKV